MIPFIARLREGFSHVSKFLLMLLKVLGKGGALA